MKTKQIETLIQLLDNHQLTHITYKDSDVEISIGKEISVGVAPSEPTKTHIETVENTIVSPLVGVYYGRLSPEQAPLVKVGQTLAVGDVICVIEAMKVMSEIKTDKAGVVKEILLQDGSPVAFDQALLVLE